MNDSPRAEARKKGLRIAARIAAAGGIALAALGTAAAARGDEPSARTTNDQAPLPLERLAKIRGGNCGCAPCWGPPAPPRKTRRRARRGARR